MTNRHGRGERGEGSFNTIVTVAVLAFAVYQAFQWTPVLISHYSFEDEVASAARFSLYKKDQQIREDLYKVAVGLDLPIKANQIKVRKESNRTRISVSYVLEVEWLPGQIYKWPVEINEDRVLF